MLEVASVFKTKNKDTLICKRVFTDLGVAKSYARQTHLTGFITHRVNGEYTAYEYKQGKVVLRKRGEQIA